MHGERRDRSGVIGKLPLTFIKSFETRVETQGEGEEGESENSLNGTHDELNVCCGVRLAELVERMSRR